jgi:signal peptidase I
MAKRERSGSGFVAFIRETTLIVVIALIASTLLRIFLLQVFVIPTRSMEKTLLVGDRVVVQKVTDFKRGGIVVFRDDLGWLDTPEKPDPAWWQSVLTFVGLLPDESHGYLIKRVIGMPGDNVRCCDAHGRITVNGEPLDEGPYLYRDQASGVVDRPSEFKFEVVVPKEHIFVLGDHRSSSADSRCHMFEPGIEPDSIAAFIPVESVTGSAVALVAPFHRWRTLPIPSTFDDVPAPAEPAPDTPVVKGEEIHC